MNPPVAPDPDMMIFLNGLLQNGDGTMPDYTFHTPDFSHISFERKLRVGDMLIIVGPGIQKYCYSNAVAILGDTAIMHPTISSCGIRRGGLADWDPTWYAPELVAEKVVRDAKARGFKLSAARVLYVLREIDTVRWTTKQNDRIHVHTCVQIHSMDITTQSVIDYHKMRESIKRLGGK